MDDSGGGGNFVGREGDLRRIWAQLEHRSVRMTGARRVGKTALLGHLERRPHRVIRIDLQGHSSLHDLVGQTEDAMNRAGLGPGGAAAAVDRVEGIETPVLSLRTRAPADSSPTERLMAAVAHGLEQVPELLVLALDEVPWWLDDLARAEGPEAARRALALLRRLREDQRFSGRFRMLLTGSVGLAGPADALGASAEINDLAPHYELGPLAPSDAMALFEAEVAVRARRVDEAACLCAQRWCAGFPHWIKAVASRAAIAVERGELVDEALVEAAVEQMLSPRQQNAFADEGEEHFARRYRSARGARLRSVLDAAAAVDGAPTEALMSAALAAGAPDRATAEADIFELVDSWHLEAAPTGGYRFVLPLFRAWWRRYGTRR